MSFYYQSTRFCIIFFAIAIGGESRDGYLKRVLEGSQVTLQCKIPLQHIQQQANIQQLEQEDSSQEFQQHGSSQQLERLEKIPQLEERRQQHISTQQQHESIQQQGSGEIVELLQMPVIWHRFDMKDPSNHVLISHGETLLSDNLRFHVTFDPASGNSILLIDKVQVQDSGSYQCQVLADNEEITSPPIQLIVKPQEVPTGPSTSSSSAIGPLSTIVLSLLAVISQASWTKIC